MVWHQALHRIAQKVIQKGFACDNLQCVGRHTGLAQPSKMQEALLNDIRWPKSR